MPRLPAIRAKTASMFTQEMLEFLIKERFPGETVVTSSLTSKSIVVLKMVADIDPTTPVVFCQPGTPFPENKAYREHMIELLGLTNVSLSVGRESTVQPNDVSHVEQMWAEYEHQSGRTFELVHLNDSLAPYECWISSVCHTLPPENQRNRVDVEGRLIRVSPIIRWSVDEVRQFMADHNLPYFEKTDRDENRPDGGSGSNVVVPTYGF